MENSTDTNNETIEENFLFDYEEVNSSDIKKMKDKKLLPSATREELKDFATNLNKDKFAELPNEDQVSTVVTLDTEDYINPEDLGKRELNANITNDPEFENVSLKPKDLTINKRVKTQKAALMKLSQKAGMGHNIHIPLWHSGFWVTYSPMVDEDIINLELEIVNELARVGKETSTLIFSNYNVIFAEVILKHFKNRIVNTTVALEDGDDIFEYININDIYTIALFMAKSMFPNGFQAIIPCTNNSVLNENELPVCSNKVRVKVDLNELLFVDESKLTKDHLSQMAKKTPNSLTTDEVIKYQETLPTNGDEEKIFKTEEGEIKIILGPVSTAKYIESGELFITTLREKAIDLIKNNKQLENADQAERVILNGIYLNVYSHYIKGIPVDDAIINDQDKINEALSILTSEHKLSKEILESIKKYVDNSQISIVGIPNFVCTTCGATQTSKELIPLAVYEYFFTLLHSRYERILEKM